MKILLIDPDEYYHGKFKQVFESSAEIISALTGNQAYTLLRRHSPDVVVMELLLPDSSGYEIMENFNRRLNQKSIPIVIYSRISHLEDAESTLRLGASAHFIKGRDRVEDIFNFIRLTQNQYDYV